MFDIKFTNKNKIERSNQTVFDDQTYFRHLLFLVAITVARAFTIKLFMAAFFVVSQYARAFANVSHLKLRITLGGKAGAYQSGSLIYKTKLEVIVIS
jgi:hypothetical protein